jgi:predicted dehydrogenase
MAGCEVAALCDVDRRRLDVAGKINARAQRKTDVRKLLDDKSIDGMVVATPDHWHALTTVWACQVGKHVYVEAPVSHDVRETEVMLATAAKYNRIVQAGTPLRSQKQVAELRRDLGQLGKVSVARIALQLPRTRPPKRGDSPPPESVDFNLWLGPAPERPFNLSRFHGTWRWFWDYGNGLLGERGMHFLDLACWLLDLKVVGGISLSSSGGMFDEGEKAGEAPDTQIATFKSGPVNLIWEHRAWLEPNKGSTFTMSFHGGKSTLIVDPNGWRVIVDGAPERPEDKGSPDARGGKEAPEEPADGQRKFRRLFDSTPHLENFVECVRTGKPPNGNVKSVFPGTLLCHLGNIAWRRGAGKEHHFDMREMRFVGSAEANVLLRREYRRPFTFPN